MTKIVCIFLCFFVFQSSAQAKDCSIKVTDLNGKNTFSTKNFYSMGILKTEPNQVIIVLSEKKLKLKYKDANSANQAAKEIEKDIKKCTK